MNIGALRCPVKFSRICRLQRFCSHSFAQEIAGEGLDMIFGFNTDVQGQDATYHVQTEDRGQRNPVIESIVYVGGKILGKKRTPYDPGTLSQVQIEDAVRQQHKELTESIRRGTWTPPAPASAGSERHSEPQTVADVSPDGKYSVELTNRTDFRQGDYFRFPIAVSSGAAKLPAGNVTLDIRWVVDGVVHDSQSLSSRADGGADVWISTPGETQSAALLIRVQGSNGTSFAKFAITPET